MTNSSNNMKEQILECPYCGNKTKHEIIFQVDSVDRAYPEGDSDNFMDIEIYFSLTKCCTCESISLFLTEQFDENPEDLSNAFLCYPYEKKVGADIPEIITKNFEEAKKVMKVSRPAFAILIRRGLEFMCRDQKAKGKTLKDKLDDLVTRSIIPSTLAEMGDALRFLGNVGAHASDYEIDRYEVEAMNDFFLTMVEYVYVAPAKLAKLKESIKKKTAINP